MWPGVQRTACVQAAPHVLTISARSLNAARCRDCGGNQDRKLTVIMSPVPSIIHRKKRVGWRHHGQLYIAKKEFGELVKKLNMKKQQNVINATGTVLHTNLGRSPTNISYSGSYTNVEYDLTTSSRGDRNSYLTESMKTFHSDASFITNWTLTSGVLFYKYSPAIWHSSKYGLLALLATT